MNFTRVGAKSLLIVFSKNCFDDLADSGSIIFICLASQRVQNSDKIRGRFPSSIQPILPGRRSVATLSEGCVDAVSAL